MSVELTVVIRTLGRARSSRADWEERYAVGGSSGVGSYGKFAEFKADANKINTIIEFGCGDGNQPRLTTYSKH
jgi:hypothetical protein